MERLLIRNAQRVFPGEAISRGSLLIENGVITALDPEPAPAACKVLDAAGKLLTPGLIDVHTHGIGTYVYENGADSLRAAAGLPSRFGTTTLLPTVVPRRDADSLRRMAQLADALPRIRGVSLPGLHLEGPFMALTGAGCAVTAGDTGFLQELLDACQGRVSAMSLSPDTPNILPVIERLMELGIRPFITHTAADVAQTEAALDAGARHATHFYDVFPAPPERDPGARPAGAVEAILADPRATVDFIADGCHVAPVVIRMAVQAKGFQGVALITDSNIGAGLPPGQYPTPWGYPVDVAPGRGARIADPGHRFHGALAGSALTMNAGVANLLRWLDLPPAQVWAMATLNPARILGLTRKGRLAVGADADLVLWNEDLSAARTWVSGQEVFNEETE